MLLHAILATDKPSLAERLDNILVCLNVGVEGCASVDEIRAHAARESTDLIFVGRDLLAGNLDDVVRSFRSLPESPDVVTLVDQENPSERAHFLVAGCLAVLYTGLSEDDLRSVCEAIVARRRRSLAARLGSVFTNEQPKLSDFVSLSLPMRSFMEVARRVAASNTTLLILGETGVGKEWLARSIHQEGPRRSGPFLPVNCAAITESLLESELFGHEEGAFTGASRSRRGCFELAHLGTLFLDEVGEMPTHLQGRLLRVLQDRTVRPVGGEKSRPIDVRVIAATNSDIRKKVAEKSFREDLYYRLSVVTLAMPALRERREDVPELIDIYVDYFRSQFSNRATGIAPGAMEAMLAYEWPGNVRELINVIERTMLVSSHDLIELIDLPEEIRICGRCEAASDLQPNQSVPLEFPQEWLAKPLSAILVGVERAYLVNVLKMAAGRMGIAAEMAGIDPRVLYDKMRRFGLRKEDFKGNAHDAGCDQQPVSPHSQNQNC
ncbi:MAG TPA: sigma-54 dependent transcriptional regulator [Thermoguttaceae bacterium]|nr:sigma-54 dependent transcriptional regulator [Thermoguttaceae bacterium]